VSQDVRVLVIEDEDSIRRLIRAALGTEGYQVTETAHGEEGVALLEQESFDLVILDIQLPGISGWDVLETMRARGLRDQVRVVMLTAQSQEREILRGWRMGVDHYCLKPFEPEEFLATVDHVLSASSEQLERDRQQQLQRTQLLHLVDSVFDT